MLTMPFSSFVPVLPDGVAYLKGQAEVGESNGFKHWQVLAVFEKKRSLVQVKALFGRECHAELSRSSASDEYVWKEATRVPDSQFELGVKPLKRNSQTDWDSVRDLAKVGNFDEIPADVYVRCYNQLSRIRLDHQVPVFIDRSAVVYYGPTQTGKSHRAWDEAGVGAYAKGPSSKWFCGYRTHEHVVIDEFRGAIGISHLLRWFDKYPVCVETKGSQVPLFAKRFWLTSNVHPRLWYPDLDEDTYKALERRLEIVHIPFRMH